MEGCFLVTLAQILLVDQKKKKRNSHPLKSRYPVPVKFILAHTAGNIPKCSSASLVAKIERYQIK